MLIICASCGRRRTLEKRSRGRLKCTRCGSWAVRAIRKIKWWIATDDYDGLSEHDARIATMAGLKWFAQAKGYSPGWAACKFRAVYGCWPNGEAQAALAAPRGELAWWINHQNAAYATMKRRERIMKENES